VTAYNNTTGGIDDGTEVKPMRPRASLIVFFLVSFGIPWATWIALKISHLSFTEGPPLALMVGAAFCSVGGVVATYIENGRSGLRDRARRCVLYQCPLLGGSMRYFWFWVCMWLPAHSRNWHRRESHEHDPCAASRRRHRRCDGRSAFRKDANEARQIAEHRYLGNPG
jgi:hypothetical protein